jgi:hypothetical protein
LLRFAAKLPELGAMIGMIAALAVGFGAGVPVEAVLMRAILATLAFGALGMFAGLLLAAVLAGGPQEERVQGPTK